MTSGVGRRQVGRATIDEQPGALIVTAPFLSRRRAAGTIAVFGGCGYLALILAPITTWLWSHRT